MANLPWYGTAYSVGVSLFTSAGLITNPGTITCKISKDFGDYADCHGTGPTEEDSTYGQIKVALDATDMTADHIDGYVIDNTSGCFAAVFHIDTIPVVRGLAGTALPNAAADAAGGLPISDAGGLDLDTYIKRLEAAWTAALAARIDENISAAKTLTAGYDAAKTAAAAGAAMTLTAAYDAAKTAAAAGAKMDLVDAPNATALAAIKTALEAAGSHLTLIKAVTDAQGGTGAGLTALGDARLANLDAAISTRLATTGYTAPDNAGIADIPTNAELATALAAADDAMLAAIGALNDLDATAVQAAASAALVTIFTAALQARLANAATVEAVGDIVAAASLA